MNLLLTGSAGFIGSHLYQELSKTHKVVGIDNMSHPCKNIVDTQYCDVRNYTDLLPYFNECDFVFHLAAQISVDRSIENPEETIETNILGTQNILELARRFKVRVIFASSSEIYGTSQKDFIDESHPLDAHSPYGVSKIAGDRMCLAYNKTYGLKNNIVRNFNTFGPYQDEQSYGGVIAKFVDKALRNEPLIIYGDGTQERDYMYVDDAVQAYKIAMSEFDGPVNFGTGQTVRIIDLAEYILKKTKSQSKIVHVPGRKGEVQRLCADITKAKTYGFKPKKDFYENLDDYIKWKE